MIYPNKMLSAAAIAGSMALAGLGFVTPTQAAGVTFSVGTGVTHNGVELRFRNGRFDNNYCLSSGEIRSQLRSHGFRSVQIIRDLGRNTVLAVGRKGTHWYQLVVNSCTGAVDQQRIRRSPSGNFSFSFTFGGGSGFEGGRPGHDGFPGGGHPGPGDGNGNGGPPNGGPGNGGPGGGHEKLVCYVTFFNASQVAAGADANVESAQVMPQSQAQAIDRPGDRSAIFDYGSEEKTISTCNYLDHIN